MFNKQLLLTASYLSSSLWGCGTPPLSVFPLHWPHTDDMQAHVYTHTQTHKHARTVYSAPTNKHMPKKWHKVGTKSYTNINTHAHTYIQHTHKMTPTDTQALIQTWRAVWHKMHNTKIIYTSMHIYIYIFTHFVYIVNGAAASCFWHLSLNSHFYCYRVWLDCWWFNQLDLLNQHFYQRENSKRKWDTTCARTSYKEREWRGSWATA